MPSKQSHAPQKPMFFIFFLIHNFSRLNPFLLSPAFGTNALSVICRIPVSIIPCEKKSFPGKPAGIDEYSP